MDTSNDVEMKADDVTPAQPSSSPAPAAAAAASTSSAPVRLPADLSLIYSLIVRQLRDDGFEAIAKQLSIESGVTIDPTFPRSQLSVLVNSALSQITVQEELARSRMELGRGELAMHAADESNEQEGAAAIEEQDTNEDVFITEGTKPSNLLDLTSRTRISTLSTPFPDYTVRYSYSHSSSATCAAFSSDGALAATGSRDTSIRLIDVARAKFDAAASEGASATTANRIQKKRGLKPLLRTYYDHESAVSDLAFHPFEPFLLSGSRDQTLKFFNYASAVNSDADEQTQSAITRRCTKVLALENAPVTSLSFHPSGDFVLVATDQNFCRLYDTQTFSAYTSPDFASFHSATINSVRWNPVKGSTYATASSDGDVKIWDGTSSMLTRTISAAHGGAEVSSVEYSPSGQYLLTSGKDSTSKLWEAATGRCLQTYKGTKHEQSHMKAQFEHSGEFVLCGDEASTGFVVWDTRTSEQVRRLDFRARGVRSFAVSPTEPVFLSVADDSKCKLWSV